MASRWFSRHIGRILRCCGYVGAWRRADVGGSHASELRRGVNHYAWICVIAAGLLHQEFCNWIKPFAGAILAIVGPVSLGFFVGFLLGCDPDAKEKTVLARFIKIALALLAGASLISLGGALEIAEVYMPRAAVALNLSRTVLVLLLPTFFVPALLMGYLWRSKQLSLLDDLFKFGGKVLTGKNVMDMVLGKTTIEGEEVFDLAYRMLGELERHEGGSADHVSAMNLYRKQQYEAVIKLVDMKRSEIYRLEDEERGQLDLLYGASLMELGQYEEALPYLRQVSHVEAFKPGIHILLARCYSGLGRFKDAEEYYASYLKDQPGDAEVATKQLATLKKHYDSVSEGDQKKSIQNQAKEYANKEIKNGVLNRKDVKRMWEDLVPEVNGG